MFSVETVTVVIARPRGEHGLWFGVEAEHPVTAGERQHSHGEDPKNHASLCHAPSGAAILDGVRNRAVRYSQ